MSRLALQFANCQLAQSGQKSFPCEAEESVAACLETVDTNAWTSYTNFYSHTHNMCYFLKSQQWQVRLHMIIFSNIHLIIFRRIQTSLLTNFPRLPPWPWRSWRSRSSCSRR